MATVCAAPRCPNLRPCPTHNAPASNDRGRWWSAVIVPAILARDGHACVMCHRPCPHPNHHNVDHIVPRIEGGSDDSENLRTVCVAFNQRGACR